MIKIRLLRKGFKEKSNYIIVVSNSKYPRNGKFIDKIGYYNPFLKKIKIDINKFKYWKNIGAKLNNSVIKIYKIYLKKICIY